MKKGRLHGRPDTTGSGKNLLKAALFTLAAAYCFGLVKGHPFHDGNKRTAYLVALIFFELNGYECAPGQIDIINTILAAADGSLGEDGLAEWFRLNSRPM